MPLFEKHEDYVAFEKVLDEAYAKTPMRVISYCLMPNHWHLVLWPTRDGQTSRYMQWLTTTHMRRWHAHRGTRGTGPVYQGRFKSFPIQEDRHFLIVCRYVERNALRANLVEHAEDWPWWGMGLMGINLPPKVLVPFSVRLFCVLTGCARPGIYAG